MNNGVFLGMKMIRNGWVTIFAVWKLFRVSRKLTIFSIRYMKLENQKLKYQYMIMVRNGHK